MLELRKSITLLTILTALSMSTSCVEPDTTKEAKSATGALFGDVSSYWGSPDIEVCWEDSNWSIGRKVEVRRLVESTWGRTRGIRFTGWSGCDSNSEDIRINVQPSMSGASTAVGLGQNNTGIFYRRSGNPSDNEILHEFGHALGFHHEQARVDTPLNCRSQPFVSDFDGDGIEDIGVFDPTVTNNAGDAWRVREIGSSTSVFGGTDASFGTMGDLELVGDFNGDGLTDTAVFRTSNSTVYYESSASGNTITTTLSQFEAGSDVFAFDIDGDSRDEIVAWSADSGDWRVWNAGSNTPAATISYGVSGDVPLVGVVDGSPSFVIWRPSSGQWFARTINSSANRFPSSYYYGASGDRVFLGEWDGNNFSREVFIYRPSSGDWFVRSTSGAVLASWVTFGGSEHDSALVGDLDGDGRDEGIVYRIDTAEWFALEMSTQQTVVSGLVHGTPLGKPNYPNSESYGSYDYDSIMGDGYCGNASGISPTDVDGTEEAYPPFDEPFIADFDGDGRQEAAIFRHSNGRLYSRELGSGTNVVNGAQVPVPSGPIDMFFGDFDGDNDDDVGYFARGSGWVYLFDPVAGTYISYFQSTLVDERVEIVAVDSDSDGTHELALWDPEVELWTVWEPNGTVKYSWSASGSGPNATARSGRIGGRPVLTTYSPSSGLWFGTYADDGTTAFQRQFGNYVDQPIFRDYDLDGNADLLHFRDHSVTWWGSSTTGSTFGFNGRAFGQKKVYPFLLRDGSSVYLTTWNPTDATWRFSTNGLSLHSSFVFGWSR